MTLRWPKSAEFLKLNLYINITRFKKSYLPLWFTLVGKSSLQILFDYCIDKSNSDNDIFWKDHIEVTAWEFQAFLLEITHMSIKENYLGKMGHSYFKMQAKY